MKEVFYEKCRLGHELASELSTTNSYKIRLHASNHMVPSVKHDLKKCFEKVTYMITCLIIKILSLPIRKEAIEEDRFRFLDYR